MQFYKILSIVFWISQLIYSQCDIISLTAKINSSNRFERIEAIDSILMCNLPEAVPYLENRILIEGDPSIALRLLFALDSLGSENILPISLELLSSFENGKFSDRGNNLINKIIIVDILFNNGSFSKSHLVLDFLNMYPDGYDPIILALLEKIIQKDSVLNQLAKQKIEEAVDKNISLTNKIIALKILSRNFGNEKTDFFKELILTNQDQSIRSVAIDCLLEINIPSSKEFLTNRLYLDSSETIRRKIARLLLSHWGTPSDYLTINEYRSLEPDGSVRKSIIDFIDFFRPPIHTDSINITIDNLLNVVNEIMIYTWLGDLSFSNELKNILTTAKTYLQNGDSLACRVQVKAFQDLVDNVYKDSLNTDARFVTIEGWKFLYWNAQYILDRLPSPPVVVNADIEVINPAMSLVNPGAFTIEIKGTGFTTNSTVYFNGNARTTTYFSDTLLTAEIQSTDVSVAGNYPVWVSSGTTNSDTLIYSVVTTLPKPVRPVLECVTNNGDGTYTAYFGYKNDNTVSVYIPAGIKNKFTPTPQDRGQTKVFLPGRKYKVFTVSFNGSNLVWSLNGRTSTASSNSAPCN